jgi:twitching motility protein PilT
MTSSHRLTLEQERELDFSHPIHGTGRFRVNVSYQRDSLGAVMRAIPDEIMSVEELGLPKVMASFAQARQGFVLVTGPTGAGKTTTLAALIDLVNTTRHDHIVTIEDPIEFMHRHKKSIVSQREIGSDTKSFTGALKHALRQDPDVILVGEMRDLETIAAAITAAETGHLVFATLHTRSASQSIERMIDVFPAHQQSQVRVQLAGSLNAIVSQQLVRRADGKGRVPAVEILVATGAIRNLIREGKDHQIQTAIQSGAQHGMQTMDASLAAHLRSGAITRDAAFESAHDPDVLTALL